MSGNINRFSSKPGAVVRPNINIHRLEESLLRREGAQAQTTPGLARPNMGVKPVSPPQRVMPNRPLPPPVAGKTLVRTVPPPLPVTPHTTGVVTPAAAFTGLALLNVAAAHPEISTEVSSLKRSLEDLEEKSSFGSQQSDINSLDSNLNNVSQLLESAREEGYVYQSDIDEQVNRSISQWGTLRVQLQESASQQARYFQSRLPALNPQIQRLNASLSNPISAAPQIRATQDQVNHLLEEVQGAQSSIENSYSATESMANQMSTRLTQVHWAMDQLVAAKFQLQTGEDLVMAVPARWDKEGKEDPEGVLYLSNKRLVFERKEKVATKKVLFITTASELIQEVLVDQPITGVAGVKAENKGLFGHQDFLQVQFSDPKLGTVPFHINGQDSKDWAALVERVRSGKIDEERTSGAGITIADLSRPLTPADVVAIQNEANNLCDEMLLKQPRQELESLENEMSSLERKLADVRSRGYVLEKDLEADVKILAIQWDRVKYSAIMAIDNQSKVLAEQMASIQQMTAQFAGMSGNLAAARPQYMQLKSAIASAQAQADASEDTIYSIFDEYSDQVESLSAYLDWIGWMLDALSTASYRLLATESGVAAVEATWGQPGLPPENGVLFLTDQRLLWEDRTGSYELKIDIPLQKVSGVHKETGETAGQESLAFSFGAGAPLPSTKFQLAMPVAEAWLKMIGRAQSGGYAQDRAVEIDPAEIERVRNAPQQCPKCNAAFTSPILRGQTEIVCEYCGVITRI